MSLFYKEWSRPVAIKDMKEEHKLMFGFLFSLKQLVGKMSPKKYAPPAITLAKPTTLTSVLAAPLCQGRWLLRVQHEHLPTTLF